MNRIIAAVYGTVCYLAFGMSYLYLIGFLVNQWVPKSIDGGSTAPAVFAIAANFALICLFGLQHSVMARQWFKARWARVVPAVLERSSYVLATALVLGVVYVGWQPLPMPVWHVETPWLRSALWTVFAFGNLMVISATFMIDHFDLFGLRQLHAYWRGAQYRSPAFRIRGLYRYVRHPLYLGFLLLFWATPDMSLGHLLFAAGMSAYMFIGASLEERDLLVSFGPDYAVYQADVPMLVPGLRAGRCPFHSHGRRARSV